MYSFSEEILSLLRSAGWYPSRNIDISEFKNILASEGYPIHSTVLSFLSCFGNLQVRYPHKHKSEIDDDFHFKVSLAVTHIYPERVKDYSDRVSSALCVIGECNRGYMILMMDSEGKVYAGYDDFLVCVGDSGFDAIEALCSGQDLVEIP